MTDEQTHLPDKADRALRAARLLLEADDVEAALNRACYAAFYAAWAALRGVGERPTSHAGTHARFSFQFVRTGLLPPETGSLLRQAFESRQQADYEAISSFDTRAAADALADAKAFVAAVRPLVVAP